MQSINNFFIEKTEGNKTSYQINPKLALKFDNHQDAAKYLVQLIRFWAPKIQLFCFLDLKNVQKHPEVSWIFGVGTSGGCEYCNLGREIMEKIFKSSDEWDHEWGITEDLPFVLGDRCSDGWHFPFNLLEYFIKNGEGKTCQLRVECSRRGTDKWRDLDEIKLFERLGVIRILRR